MHAIITGLPGVGKTTLVQKICLHLKENHILHHGFYTQEIRNHDGARTGFQVVTLDGKIGTLSSVSSQSRMRVGQYGVELEEFERLVLPLFTDLLDDKVSEKVILILDEIGKMELFSEKFKTAVDLAFKNQRINIIATIPVAKGKPIPFVENIRTISNSTLFTIDKTNRNQIFQSILNAVDIPPTKNEFPCQQK